MNLYQKFKHWRKERKGYYNGHNAKPDYNHSFFKCRDCGFISYSKDDIKNKYCGNCHDYKTNYYLYSIE